MCARTCACVFVSLLMIFTIKPLCFLKNLFLIQMVGRQKPNKNKWSTQAVPFDCVPFIAVFRGVGGKG